MKVSDVKTLLSDRWNRRALNLKPLYLEGVHGIGKTTVVRELAQTLGVDCKVIALAGFDGPDFTGMPYVKDGRTMYARPQWLPSEGKGVLFFDEANRAPIDALQPLVNLITDREFNGHKISSDWVIVMGGNPADGDYSVGTLDKALADRLTHVNVEASHKEVVKYLNKKYEGHPLLSFVAIERNVDKLSPRSVEQLLRVSSGDVIQERTLLRLVLEAEVGPKMVGSILEHLSKNERFTLEQLREGQWDTYKQKLEESSATQALNDLVTQYTATASESFVKKMTDKESFYKKETQFMVEWIKNTDSLEHLGALLRGLNTWLSVVDNDKRQSLGEFTPVWISDMIDASKEVHDKLFSMISLYEPVKGGEYACFLDLPWTPPTK